MDMVLNYARPFDSQADAFSEHNVDFSFQTPIDFECEFANQSYTSTESTTARVDEISFLLQQEVSTNHGPFVKQEDDLESDISYMPSACKLKIGNKRKQGTHGNQVYPCTALFNFAHR